MQKPERLLTFSTREEWRAWLRRNHARETEAWLVLFKKGYSAGSLSYEEAVEEALCYGWIDGLLRRLDERRYALRYSPRKPNSVWAENNKRRVERLIRAGRMKAAGMVMVRAAKASGEWEAAARREQVDEPPPELRRALRAAGVWAAFLRLTPSRRKQHLYAVMSAKTEATRAKRVRAIVQMLVPAKVDTGPGRDSP